MAEARSIEVFPTPAALAEAAARRFAAAAIEAVTERGTFRVAFSGGSTPAPLYRLLAAPPNGVRIPWSALEVHWSDERCVPPDDAASNYRLTRATLLDRVGVVPARVHRMRGEDDPAAAAAEYERLLRSEFHTPSGPPSTRPEARFDLILLGLGQDGHVASLFPGALPPSMTERWVVAIPASPWSRITFTPPLINAAREVMVLVTGAAKAAIVRKALHPTGTEDTLPAQLIHPGEGTIRWMLDAAAAASLPHGSFPSFKAPAPHR